MSGFYNNWFKVQNPNVPNDIPPMESGGFQVPFYFGGSQVPVNLGIDSNEISGSGIHRKTNFKPYIRGKGRQCTDYSIGSNIHMPRHTSSLS